MKNTVSLAAALLLGLLTTTICVRAGNLNQTFEPGEDTSNWGSIWSGNGTTTAGFLAPSLGGQNAGIGLSSSQNFSRSFQQNTAGIGTTNPYYISMYVQVNTETNNTPNSGVFDIIDGAQGSPAADIQVRANGSGQLTWTAYNGGNYDSFGINMTLMNPYYISLSVNPITKTYSATVDAVDLNGNILQSATLTDLVSDQNIFNNHQNGILLFYLQASAGNASVLADNITVSADPITATPEPAAPALVAGGLAAILYLKRSRR